MTELDNPGLVSILDSGIEEGRPFLVMPLMIGGSLAGRLKHGDLPDAKTAATWLVAIARAIAYLHEKNMIHRDLKPSNILFDAQAQPHVADFGLVHLVEQAGGTGQVSSVVVEGTASYMAPEQASGRIKAIGRQTDVYGLGAILYEILTGLRTFSIGLVHENAGARPGRRASGPPTSSTRDSHRAGGNLFEMPGEEPGPSLRRRQRSGR